MGALEFGSESDSGLQTDQSGLAGLLASLSNGIIDALEIAMNSYQRGWHIRPQDRPTCHRRRRGVPASRRLGSEARRFQ